MGHDLDVSDDNVDLSEEEDVVNENCFLLLYYFGVILDDDRICKNPFYVIADPAKSIVEPELKMVEEFISSEEKSRQRKKLIFVCFIFRKIKVTTHNKA